METAPSGTTGRGGLASESTSKRAAGETHPTPVYVTRTVPARTVLVNGH